jgi:hypothetical protein
MLTATTLADGAQKVVAAAKALARDGDAEGVGHLRSKP